MQAVKAANRSYPAEIPSKRGLAEDHDFNGTDIVGFVTV
jgi:hypothetical protein